MVAPQLLIASLAADVKLPETNHGPFLTLGICCSRPSGETRVLKKLLVKIERKMWSWRVFLLTQGQKMVLFLISATLVSPALPPPGAEGRCASSRAAMSTKVPLGSSAMKSTRASALAQGMFHGHRPSARPWKPPRYFLSICLGNNALKDCWLTHEQFAPSTAQNNRSLVWQNLVKQWSSYAGATGAARCPSSHELNGNCCEVDRSEHATGCGRNSTLMNSLSC